MKNIHRINGLIYITSDVEVLDGQYGACLNLIREGLSANLAIFKMDKKQRRAMEELGGRKKAEVVKLILTNDPALISEGIQAISQTDENWLNDNPSCELVDLVFVCERGHREIVKTHYKINLPTHQTIEDRSYHPISLNEVSETKTIEEAAETYTEQQVFNLILLSSNMQFKSIQEVKIWITENNQQC